jgi:hypothetical protein
MSSTTSLYDLRVSSLEMRKCMPCGAIDNNLNDCIGSDIFHLRCKQGRDVRRLFEATRRLDAFQLFCCPDTKRKLTYSTLWRVDQPSDTKVQP